MIADEDRYQVPGMPQMSRGAKAGLGLFAVYCFSSLKLGVRFTCCCSVIL